MIQDSELNIGYFPFSQTPRALEIVGKWHILGKFTEYQKIVKFRKFWDANQKEQKFTVKKFRKFGCSSDLGLSTFPEVVEDALPFDTGNFPICVSIESSRNYPMSLGHIITGYGTVQQIVGRKDLCRLDSIVSNITVKAKLTQNFEKHIIGSSLKIFRCKLIRWTSMDAF